MLELMEKLDVLHDEIIEIVTNRNLDYIDDLDMIDSDINSYYENDIFEDMKYDELFDLVNHIENQLKIYKENI